MTLKDPSAFLPEADYAADIGYQLIAVTASFLVLVIVLLALRVTAHLITRRHLGFDDYFLLAGTISLIALDGMNMGMRITMTLVVN